MRSNRWRSPPATRELRAIRLAGWSVGRLPRQRHHAEEGRDHGRRRRSRSPASTAFSSGATWAPDDTIIFATNNPATGLQRVSAAGGTPEVLTRPDHAQGEADHLWPELLPGGRAVLFTITSQTGGLDDGPGGGARLAHRDAEGAAARREPRALRCRRAAHLVYVAAGTLRAIPFDPTRLETHGTAVPVLPRLVDNGHRRGRFRRGHRRDARVRGRAGRPRGERAHARVGRSQRAKRSPSPRRRAPTCIRASRPTGRASRSSSSDQENDLWIWDLGRATLTRLTLDPGQD